MWTQLFVHNTDFILFDRNLIKNGEIKINFVKIGLRFPEKYLVSIHRFDSSATTKYCLSNWDTEADVKKSFKHVYIKPNCYPV